MPMLVFLTQMEFRDGDSREVMDEITPLTVS